MSEATTLRNLLGDISQDEVSHALDLRAKEGAGAGESVLAAVRGLISEAGARELNGALDVDALGLLAQGWAKVQTLRQYRDTTKYPPTQTSIVQLGQHNMTHVLRPQVELRSAGVPLPDLPDLPLTLELDARFRSVALSVSNGRVLSAAPGDATVTVRLKYGKTTLKEKATPSWKLPGTVGFGDGIAIP